MPRIYDVGTRVQLLVDPQIIESRRGLTDRLHQLRKHPEPVLIPTSPWEYPGQGALWGPLHAHHLDGQLHLWYQAHGPYPALGETGTILRCLATSSDGVHFQRPRLGRYAWQGSKDNNVLGVRGDPGGQGHGMLDGLAIDSSEPAELRYKCVHWMGRDADGIGGHGVAFSPDGLTWNGHDGNPVVRAANSGDSVCCASLRDWFNPGPVPHPVSKYAILPKAHIDIAGFRRRCIALAVSDDSAELPFTRFSPAALILAPDEQDDEMAGERLAAASSVLRWNEPADHRGEFYGMPVFRCGDTFLGMPWAYDSAYSFTRQGGHNEYALMEVQLAASRDLYHWQRVGNRQPIIPRGPATAFDSTMIFSHSLPVEMGDEWWIYYVGFNEGHAARIGYTQTLRRDYWESVATGERHLPSVGLGRVRREGFFSLEAGAASGEFVTRGLVTTGTRLALNATVASQGEIRVEIRDTDGRALPGFAFADCQPITADGVRLPVAWRSRPDTSVWGPRPVQVAVSATAASVYAFAFQSD